jgi:hypothetical protein
LQDEAAITLSRTRKARFVASTKPCTYS